MLFIRAWYIIVYLNQIKDRLQIMPIMFCRMEILFFMANSLFATVVGCSLLPRVYTRGYYYDTPMGLWPFLFPLLGPKGHSRQPKT